MTLDTMIRARMDTLGASRRQLRANLAAHGVDVSRQTIHAWCVGLSRPAHEHLAPLLDVLLVPEAAREEWAAAWRGR